MAHHISLLKNCISSLEDTRHRECKKSNWTPEFRLRVQHERAHCLNNASNNLTEINDSAKVIRGPLQRLNKAFPGSCDKNQPSPEIIKFCGIASYVDIGLRALYEITGVQRFGGFYAIDTDVYRAVSQKTKQKTSTVERMPFLSKKH